MMDRYGRLVVLSAESRGGEIWCFCLCDCGRTKTIRRKSLHRGATKSCGCLRDEGRAPRHGHSRRMRATRIYQTWEGMLTRCRNPNFPEYPLYGGRGIKVCERWLRFENFLVDMGEPPPGTSLDRINNNGHYEPNNCRWATSKMQARNRRNNRLLTHNGKTQTLAAWSEEVGLLSNTINMRLRRGWSIVAALGEN